MIRKVGNEYVLYSMKKGKDGKRKILGRGTKSEMEKRERQVQYFKHNK
jgi:hypothetical protein